MTPSENLESSLVQHPRSPFFFIGSGFSLRYLGLPGWEDLLRQFCKGPSPYEYYLASSDKNLPKCASLLAKDYAEYWWRSPETAEMRTTYAAHLTASTSPLKIAISEFIAAHTDILDDEALREEVETIQTLNIEGIITTNWDLLLEQLFPGYKVYIGQQSVVRQTPQNVAEIYKIHGCCSDPNSLVLTHEDYERFKETQAYLAAKLITIFVEHPVIFIGYSISDPDILDLLRAILKGLGSEEQAKLQRNLIFVQRTKANRPVGISQTILVVDGTPLPVTQLVTDDFRSIYAAIAKCRLKLPARVLRFCKEQHFEIVSSKEPSEKLCILSMDEIESKDDVEFVVGIGVAHSRLSERGYVGLKPEDLFRSLIFGIPELDAQQVLDQVIPQLSTGHNYLPVFKFLAEAKRGVHEANAAVRRLTRQTHDGLGLAPYRKAALRDTQDRNFAWIVEHLPPEKVALYLPHIDSERIPINDLRTFCQAHFERGFTGTYTSAFRKLFCLYDCLAYRSEVEVAVSETVENS